MHRYALTDFFCAAMRIAIGWHFLYEGIVKLKQPGWTSAGYLQQSQGFASELFHWIASQPQLLKVVDLLNVWGLTLIGIALFLGLMTRLAALSGVLLLALYYLAYPPFGGIEAASVSEGNYFLVNKVLIELVALAFIAAYPTRQLPGLDRLVWSLRGNRQPSPETPAMAESSGTAGMIISRREIIRNLAPVPLLGGFAALVLKGRDTSGKEGSRLDAITGPTMTVKDETLEEVTGELSQGRIGNIDVSRLILGGNLIGAYAHARDLIYVKDLFQSYNTERKVFETLMLCERTGVNTIVVVPWQLEVIERYNQRYHGNMQAIAMINSKKAADTAIDHGASALYIIGNHCDFQVRDGKIDELGLLLDYIRQQGYVAGLGAHSIQALMACSDAGIDPDFYVKTLHHDNYWSAHPKANRIPFSVDSGKSPDHNQFHDNMFCLFPDKTIEFMKAQSKPWIAFKVLAAGAIHPDVGFPYAFQNGADFICVGMFDFQVVQDVNIAIQTVADAQDRERPWYA